jgi:hypothetical protein
MHEAHLLGHAGTHNRSGPVSCIVNLKPRQRRTRASFVAQTKERLAELTNLMRAVASVSLSTPLPSLAALLGHFSFLGNRAIAHLPSLLLLGGLPYLAA